MKNHRRKISPEQKVWKKELFEGAVGVFDKKTKSQDKRKDTKITDLKATLQKRNTLIAHLVSENVELKKNELGGD